VSDLEQGDQIVRIFAQWVIVYFGQFPENYASTPPIRDVENIIVIYPTRIGSDLFFPPYFSRQLSL
jgi:hypothetical protein